MTALLLLVAPLASAAPPGPDLLVCQTGVRREDCCEAAPTRCFTTLAEAVADAADGEWIEIGAGVYPGIAEIGRSVTISGRRDSLPPVLVLDEGGDKNLVSVYGGATVVLRTVTLSSVLGRAFEVNDGSALVVEDTFLATAGVMTFGGAVRVHPGASATLRNVVIEGGTAAGRGGQIHAEQGMVTLERCTLAGGVAQDGGGAVSMQGGGSLIIRDSMLVGATSYGDGGAIWLRGPIDVRINGTTLSANRAVGAGGALALRGGVTTIEDSVVVDNEAGDDGGAIDADSDVQMTLRRTTFSGNRSLDGNGGAVAWGGAFGAVAGTWSNLWFVGNRSPGVGGAVAVEALGAFQLVRSGFVGNESGANGAAVALRRLDQAEVLDVVIAHSRGGAAVDSGGVQTSCAGVWFDNQGGHVVSRDGDPCLRGPGNQVDVDPRLYAFNDDGDAPDADFAYNPVTSPLAGSSVLGGVDLDGSPADMGPAGGPDAAAQAWVDDDGDGWPAVHDCNEAVSTVHPGIVTDRADGQDRNCDGSDLVDLDRDGWTPPADCDDRDPAVNPAASEDLDLARDLDCDGFTAPTTALSPAGCAAAGAPRGWGVALAMFGVTARRRSGRGTRGEPGRRTPGGGVG